MTGNTSNISLASNALLLLGHEPIASFTEGTAGATIAANLYDTAYLSVLTNHRWRFATKQARLARLAETPINDYTYAFQLPSDCIYLIKVDAQNYEVFGDKLYCNSSELLADYTYKVDEDRLPPYFTKMLEFFLAAQFAVSLTGSIEKGEFFSKLYVNELKKAKFADSTQTPQVTFSDSRYITARY